MKHTPTPWFVENGSVYAHYTQLGRWWSAWEHRIPIAHMDREPRNGTRPTERDANAEHIVRCVNAHDQLVEACLSAQVAVLGGGHNLTDDMHRALDKLKVALAAAK